MKVRAQTTVKKKKLELATKTLKNLGSGLRAGAMKLTFSACYGDPSFCVC